VFIFHSGKVTMSHKTGVMILLESDEIEEIKKLPPGHNIYCTFPKNWGAAKGRRWMEDNKNRVIDAAKKEGKIESPSPSPAQPFPLSPPPPPPPPVAPLVTNPSVLIRTASDNEIVEMLKPVTGPDSEGR